MTRIARIILLLLLIPLHPDCARLSADCAPGDAGCDPLTGALVYALYISRLFPVSGRVSSYYEISDQTGGFTATLDDVDAFGYGAAAPGDINGDGFDDIVFGAIRDDDGQPNSGALYVFFLDGNGFVQSWTKISDTQGNLTTALSNAENFGRTNVGAGDRNHDGVPDLYVSGSRRDDGGTERGAVYEVLLNRDGTVLAEQRISQTEGNLPVTLADNDRFGSSVAILGDVNGDGIEDRAVSAEFDDDGGIDRGAIYILFMNADGTVNATQKISQNSGNLAGNLSDGDRMGSDLAGIGDLNQDGVPDLAAGVYASDHGGIDAGIVYVFFLNVDGTIKSQTTIGSGQGGLSATIEAGDRFGFSVRAPGDINGDGIPDLIVGATQDDDGGTDRGAVYFLYMNRDGTVSAHSKISQTEGNFNAALADIDLFGTSLASPGDLNGDNVPDLLVGVEGDDGGGSNRGGAYVLFLESAYQ